MNNPALDNFAELVIERHDSVVERFERILDSHSETHEDLRALQNQLAGADPVTRDAIRRCIRQVTKEVLAQTLFTVSELADTEEWEIKVRGQKLSDLTPGLHYELSMPDGWMKRFSRYHEGRQ